MAIEVGVEALVAEAPARWAARRRVLVATLGAVVGAFAVGAVVLALTGNNPLVAFGAMLDGAFGSPLAIGQVLTYMVPLLLIGLGLALAFRGRVYNIGGEGQFLVGAVAGTTFALYADFGGPLVMVPLTAAVGMAAGAAWGGVVGVLRGRWGINEIIVSLLLNYVATFIFNYMFRRPLRSEGGLIPVSRDLPASTGLAILPGLRVHIGIVLALALVPLLAYVITRTPFGFRVGMLGLNAEAAEVAGVDRARLITWLMAVSGGLAGLAGIVHVMGVSRHLQTGFSPGFGFTAIVVALLGRNRAFGVLAGALFMAALAVGGQAMSFAENVPFGVVLLIQALFVVFLLIGDRLARR